MLKIAKTVGVFFLTGIFLFSSSEANWITKKSEKSKEIIKEEKKEKSKWIQIKKKEEKKNKEEYKKKEKNISKEIRKWITKKTKKDEFLNFNELPNSQIYFTALGSDGRVLYGYINDDKNSKSVNHKGSSFYQISIGKGYFLNSKITCNIVT